MEYRPGHATPVSVLNESILSRIFVIGQALSIVDDIEFVSPLIPFEIKVSGVSNHWRRVALATSELWRRIEVVPEKTMAEIETYCQRSGRCPIDIRFDASHWNGATLSPELIALLTKRSSSWRKADLVLSLADINHPLLRYLLEESTAGLQLQHLSLSVTAGPSCSCDGALAQLLTPPIDLQTSALKFVRLRGYSAHFFRPSLTSVTTLHLEIVKSLPLGYTVVREFLTAASQLVNLSLYGDDDPFLVRTWPTLTRTIVLPRLQSLRLRATHGPTFATILTHIDAPSLRSLYLKELQENDLDPFWPYAVINGGCFPKLETLAFYDFDFADITYANVWAAFPNITQFTLIHPASEGTSIVKLLGHRRYARMWPRLRTLSTLLITANVWELCDMLTMRDSVDMPLRKLRIGGSRSMLDPSELNELRKYVQLELFEELDHWTGCVEEDDIF